MALNSLGTQQSSLIWRLESGSFAGIAGRSCATGTALL